MVRWMSLYSNYPSSLIIKRVSPKKIKNLPLPSTHKGARSHLIHPHPQNTLSKEENSKSVQRKKERIPILVGV